MRYQDQVKNWITEAFGEETASNSKDRADRFLEEAIELYQATGGTKEDAMLLVSYVFNRPVGEIHQELGGSYLTLSGLAAALNIDLHSVGFDELHRAWSQIEQIRKKQSTKIRNSPLPGKS